MGALKFYKGWYGKGNSKTLPNESKAIIFNEEEGIIYVNGRSYGGATDVTFANGVLTISYADGRDNVTLDFNDTASAQATLAVFGRIDNLIGPNVNVTDGDGTLNYTNTNYLTNKTTLVAADKALDTAIKAVDTRIDNLDTQSDVQAVTLTAASENNGAKLTFNGVSQTDGAIAAGTSTTELQFAKVATTGAAADVSIADSGNKITATNVEDALAELAGRITDTTVSVDSNEKMLAMSNTNVLSTTLSVAIEKQGESGNQKDYIVLKGIGGAEISKVDATAFVKDGMLSGAELVTVAEQDVTEVVPYIKLTWNTDAGSTVTRFSVKSLVDTYTSGDTNALTINGYVITPKTGAVAQDAGTLTTGGQVYTAIQNATNQLDNTSRIKEVRRNIARIQTVLQSAE